MAIGPAALTRPGRNTGIIMASVFALLFVSLLIGGIWVAVSSSPVPATVAKAGTVPVASAPTPYAPVELATPSSPVTVPSPTATRSVDLMGRARLAAVWILVPADDPKISASLGSGSIIDDRGLILTNYHVVRNADGKGEPYNRRDIIVVLAQSFTDKPPDRGFVARVVELDDKLDLAVIRLTATEDGKPLPPNLGLSVVPLGDSDIVTDDQDIRAIGFQRGSALNLKDVTVTSLKGSVSGFVENHTWIKTDAQIDHGISGGLAVNLAGELIGVPTALSGRIGYIRPINLAKPLIAKAK